MDVDVRLKEVLVNLKNFDFDIFGHYKMEQTEVNKLVDALVDMEESEKVCHCKNCKYFEYDSISIVDGVPLILAHENCTKWGGGCKTKEDGYCFMFEPQVDSGNTEV